MYINIYMYICMYVYVVVSVVFRFCWSYECRCSYTGTFQATLVALLESCQP